MFGRIYQTKVILFLIILVAFFLRFWSLGQNPPSLTWDEVAWGYNAYSLGLDGRDEFGRFLPMDYLESFGDFKPPVYAYLDILPVKIFGLNEFAVRFPSAFFGVLTVLITYFLTKRIFPGFAKFSIFNFQFSIAEIAAAVLAISPWHINLSRAAFEANIASFFLISGIWLFLVGVQSKPKYLIFSGATFVLSIYTFNTARVVTPILIFVLAIGFRSSLIKQKRETIIAIIFGFILLLPTLTFLFSPQASLRFKEVNIFSDIDVINRTNQQIDNDGNIFWSKIIHNRRFTYGVEFLKHYFDNFSSDFLFIKGDGNPKFSTQVVGQLYLWEFPFLVVGLIFLFRKKEGKWWIIPFWLILGIMPAATARETPHALRIETTIPTFQILVAYGLIHFVYLLKRYKILFLYIITVCILLNLVYYIYDYYANYSYVHSHEWQYGYKDSISYVKRVESQYDQVSISDSLGRPYIYYLFYTKTDPNYFRQTSFVSRDVFGFVYVKGFGKYKFSDNPNNIAKGKAGKILYINKPQQVPEEAKILKELRALNGDIVLVAYTHK